MPLTNRILIDSAKVEDLLPPAQRFVNEKPVLPPSRTGNWQLGLGSRT